MTYPDYFGKFGGQYVAEVLRAPLEELQKEFLQASEDPGFWKEIEEIGKTYIGRPTPLLYAENATREIGGGRIYIKLEGLAQTGAHKINNAIGQVLLAARMGKKRIIAETGAGQHGVAVSAVCARMGIPCTIYMGEVDIRRQRPNVFWMEMYGATVVPVHSGSRTLKDAINDAYRDWAASYDSTYYLIGSALGPAPYPDMVREFQSVIGKETRQQAEEMGFTIDTLVACVGGGSNAIGFFEPFLDEAGDTIRLVGAEAGGTGTGPGKHASRMTGQGREGIVQGYRSMFLLDEEGQVGETHSISAGLDYPGIGPQLAALGKEGKIDFMSVRDNEALEALSFFARNEGVLFAMESAHAGAAGMKIAREMTSDQSVIIHMSGRGEKDLFIAAGALAGDEWAKFLRDEADTCEGKTQPGEKE